MREQALGAKLLHDSVSGASSLVCTEICFAGACFRSKLPRVYRNLLYGSVFQEQAPSCVLVGVLTREHVSGACFRSKLLRVYWLGYLPGSVFRERVSGASSLVCTDLKRVASRVNSWAVLRVSSQTRGSNTCSQRFNSSII